MLIIKVHRDVNITFVLTKSGKWHKNVNRKTINYTNFFSKCDMGK